MGWIKRDDAGRIIAISEQPMDGFEPVSAVPDQDMAAFINRIEHTQQALAASDHEFIRVIEDLVMLLVAQNQIRFTDLPDSAQQKMLERQQLRTSMHDALQLLPEDEDELI